MRLRLVGIALLAGSTVVTAQGPGTCPRDSKLVNGGPTAVFGEGPGTWWGLVIDGLNAAGLNTVAEKIEWLNQCFGTTFDNLDDLKADRELEIGDIAGSHHHGHRRSHARRLLAVPACLQDDRLIRARLHIAKFE